MDTSKEVKIVTMSDNLNAEAICGENTITFYGWGHTFNTIDSWELSFEQAKLLVKTINKTISETQKEEKNL